ncbi:MAG: NADPH:quinone reductase [Frankiaceae bacterium]|nr:NADPH:quinone reductase [Frankiaceae bacterium]MDX6273593.1 NADPH:quinone reductase [Frankiales bacterium]
MRAIQITEFGGPEVLQLVELPDPDVPEGFVGIEVSAAGVNYADTHQTEDSYLAKQTLPLIPGGEAVGRTSDGRRVVALLSGGGYAQKAVAHPSAAFDVPDEVSDGQALSLVLQGLTAWHLLRTSTRMQPGESVVVHAAAGGVGTIAIQLAKAWGAGRVIACASSPDKRELALSLGADVAVDPAEPDLKTALREANGGAPVDVVLEMVGGTVFDQSLAALAPFGRMATFGMAGRTPPSPINAGELMGRSRAVIGFWLVHCFGRPEMMQVPMAELLSMVAAGSLSPVLGGSYPLAEARAAHEDLRARRSVGKLVLDPTR